MSSDGPLNLSLFSSDGGHPFDIAATPAGHVTIAARGVQALPQPMGWVKTPGQPHWGQGAGEVTG